MSEKEVIERTEQQLVARIADKEREEIHLRGEISALQTSLANLRYLKEQVGK
jgi:hypothetical protein